MDEARAYGIPIICVVDADKQLAREVIDCYMEKGLGWLFDAQLNYIFAASSQKFPHFIFLGSILVTSADVGLRSKRCGVPLYGTYASSNISRYCASTFCMWPGGGDPLKIVAPVS